MKRGATMRTGGRGRPRVAGAAGSRRLKRSLDGVRILAVEQMLAAPFGTQLLADHGADVVGVEPVGYASDESVPWRLRTGRWKRRVSIDLAAARGQELVRRLARRADVFVENYRPGVLEKYGLGYQRVRRTNPRVVYASVSGFGHRDFLPSPLSELAAYGPIAEAVSGITAGFLATGSNGKTVHSIGDIVSSLFAVSGILMALRARDITGRGQYIDVSMADSLFALGELRFVKAMITEADPNAIQPQMGLLNAVMRARDGRFLLIVIRAPHWRTLAPVIGRADWLSSAWFGDPVERDAMLAPEVIPAVEKWSMARPVREVVDTLRAVGLAVAPVQEPMDTTRDAHFLARRMIALHRQPDGTVIRVPGDPVKLSEARDRQTKTDAPIPIAVPGQHTREVLVEWLGLTGRQVERLLRDGVVAQSEGPGRVP